MYEYNICTQADEDIFYKQCAALEKKLDNLKKEKLIQDVDNSLIQKYTLEGKSVEVFNDNYIGSVYIKSDIDLERYF